MMVYLGALVFGGVLLGASMLGGQHEAGAHAGDAGDGHAHDGDGHQTGAAAVLLPVLSIRFWLFALTFFGLTGVLATWAGAAGLAVPLASSGVGLASGYGAARLMQSLTRTTVGLIAGAEAHVGREGKLLLPVARGQRGKIRLTINGTQTDLVAETESESPLPIGGTALIVGLRGNIALIEGPPTVRPDSIPPSEPKKEST